MTMAEEKPENIDSVLAQIQAMISSLQPGPEQDRLQANFDSIVRQLGEVAQLVVTAEANLRDELEKQLAANFTDGSA
jgi:hypothetical protein